MVRILNEPTAVAISYGRDDKILGEGSDKNSDTIRVVVNIRYKEGSIDLGDNVEQVVAESVDKS